MIYLVLIVVFWAVAWFGFVLPARRRRSSHAAMQESVGIGDEVITAGGLHAIVRGIEEDRVRVELAPDVVATLDRRAIAAVAREVEVEVEPEDEHDEVDEYDEVDEHSEV